MINDFQTFFEKINVIDTQIGLPKIYRHLAVIKRSNKTVTGSGFSINEKNSRMSSMGEAVERYCASIKLEGESGLHEFSDLEKIEIKDITRASYLNDYNPKREWVKVKELSSEKEILLPSEMVYLSQPNYEPIRDIISTGLATYTTTQGAIERGLCECIERDAFIQFWMLSRLNFKIGTNEIKDPEIKVLFDKGAQSGLKIEIYDISTEFEVPVILTIIKKTGVSGFYLSCAANFDYDKAIKKSLEEGLGGYSVYIESTLVHQKNVPLSIDNIHDLSERPIYYLNQKKDYLLDKILARERNSKKIINYSQCYRQKTNLEQVLFNFKKKDIKVYYKEITTPDVQEVGFRVVRVVVPKLAFLPVKEPMILCKRLKNKSIDLGRNYNLEPHPFP